MRVGGQAWLSKAFNVLYTLSYPDSTIEPTLVGPKKNFQNKSSQVAGKRCLEIGFAYTVFYKSAILLIFEAEFTESVF